MPRSSTISSLSYATALFALAASLLFFAIAFPADAQTANTIGSGNTSQGTTIGTGNTTGGSGCGSSGGGQTIANPLKFCSLEQLLDALLDAAIKLGAVILTLALIYTGFLFVAARGNEEKIRKARTALLYTVIGGLILLGAKAIEVVIRDTVTSLTP